MSKYDEILNRRVADLAANSADIYDGDTFTTRAGETIRVNGIDTPEINLRGSGDMEEGAIASTQGLQALHNNGYDRVVTERGLFGDKTGKYGRTLGDLANEAGKLASEELLKAGLAVPRYSDTPEQRQAYEAGALRANFDVDLPSITDPALQNVLDEQVITSKPALRYDSAERRLTVRPRSDFVAGLASGVSTTKALVGGFGAILGIEGAEDYYNEQMEIAGAVAPRVSRIEDIESGGDIVDWMQGALGQAAPTMLPVIAGGGAGGLIGRYAAKRGIKSAMTKAIAKQLPTVSANQALFTARNIIGDPAMAALMKRSAMGGYGGAWLANSVMQSSGIYNELKNDGIEDRATALVFGAAAGAVETAADVLLFKRLFPNAKAHEVASITDLAKRIGAGMLQQGLAEGTSEGASEAIQLAAHAYADPEFDVFAIENRSQLINSVAAGAVAGMFFGAAGDTIGGVNNYIDSSLREDRRKRAEADLERMEAENNGIVPGPELSDQGPYPDAGRDMDISQLSDAESMATEVFARAFPKKEAAPPRQQQERAEVQKETAIAAEVKAVAHYNKQRAAIQETIDTGRWLPSIRQTRAIESYGLSIGRSKTKLLELGLSEAEVDAVINGETLPPAIDTSQQEEVPFNDLPSNIERVQEVVEQLRARDLAENPDEAIIEAENNEQGMADYERFQEASDIVANEEENASNEYPDEPASLESAPQSTYEPAHGLTGLTDPSPDVDAIAHRMMDRSIPEKEAYALAEGLALFETQDTVPNNILSDIMRTVVHLYELDYNEPFTDDMEKAQRYVKEVLFEGNPARSILDEDPGEGSPESNEDYINRLTSYEELADGSVHKGLATQIVGIPLGKLERKNVETLAEHIYQEELKARGIADPRAEAAAARGSKETAEMRLQEDIGDAAFEFNEAKELRGAIYDRIIVQNGIQRARMGARSNPVDKFKVRIPKYDGRGDPDMRAGKHATTKFNLMDLVKLGFDILGVETTGTKFKNMRVPALAAAFSALADGDGSKSWRTGEYDPSGNRRAGSDQAYLDMANKVLGIEGKEEITLDSLEFSETRRRNDFSNSGEAEMLTASTRASYETYTDRSIYSDLDPEVEKIGRAVEARIRQADLEAEQRKRYGAIKRSEAMLEKLLRDKLKADNLKGKKADDGSRIATLDQIKRSIAETNADISDMRKMVELTETQLVAVKDGAPIPSSVDHRATTPAYNALPTPVEGKPTYTYAGVGSRSTPDAVVSEIHKIAKYLSTLGYALNTGDAKGADTAFAAGASDASATVYTARDATEQTRIIAKEIHPAPKNLKKWGLDLMARNTMQVFGGDLTTPVDFVVAYTPDGAETTAERSYKTGGTGQAIDLAARKSIPVVNLAKPGWQKRLRAIVDGTNEKPSADLTPSETMEVQAAADYIRSEKFAKSRGYSESEVIAEMRFDAREQFANAPPSDSDGVSSGMTLQSEKQQKKYDMDGVPRPRDVDFDKRENHVRVLMRGLAEHATWPSLVSNVIEAISHIGHGADVVMASDIGDLIDSGAMEGVEAEISRLLRRGKKGFVVYGGPESKAIIVINNVANSGMGPAEMAHVVAHEYGHLLSRHHLTIEKAKNSPLWRALQADADAHLEKTIGKYQWLKTAETVRASMTEEWIANQFPAWLRKELNNENSAFTQSQETFYSKIMADLKRLWQQLSDAFWDKFGTPSESYGEFLEGVIHADMASRASAQEAAIVSTHNPGKIYASNETPKAEHVKNVMKKERHKVLPPPPEQFAFFEPVPEVQFSSSKGLSRKWMRGSHGKGMKRTNMFREFQHSDLKVRKSDNPYHPDSSEYFEMSYFDADKMDALAQQTKLGRASIKGFNKVSNYSKSIASLIMPVVRKTLGTSAHMLRHYGLDSFADQLEPYYANVAEYRAIYRKQYADVSKDMIAEFGKGTPELNAAMDSLVDELRGYKPLSKYGVRVRKLLDDVFDYYNHAVHYNSGKIEAANNFYAIRYDPEALSVDGAEKEFVDIVAAKFVEWTAQDGAHALELSTAEAMARGVYDNLQDPTKRGQAYELDADLAKVLGTSASSTHPRTAIASIRALDKFRNSTPDLDIPAYIDEQVHRGEQSRMWGGESHPTEEAAAAGAGPVYSALFELDEVLKARTQFGTMSPDEYLHITSTVWPALMGNLGSNIDPTLRKTIAYMQMYQNFRTLLFATLSSISDLGLIYNRTGGDFAMTLGAFKEGIAAYTTKSDLNEMAELMGLMGNRATAHLMHQMYGDPGSGDLYSGSGRVERWNDRFFTATGLEQWTNMTRVMGLSAAMKFVDKHIDNDSKKSQRWMKEMKVDRLAYKAWRASGSIAYGTDGNTIASVEHELAMADAAAKPALKLKLQAVKDAKSVSDSLLQFVNTASLNPNASQRPAWASDPHYALFWHLKQFMYTMQTQIIDRNYKEIKASIKDGEGAQVGAYALSAMSLLPFAAAGLVLRNMLQYGLWGDEPPEDRQMGWELGYLFQLLERSGGAGVGMLVFDTAEASDRGGYMLLSPLGPAVNQLQSFLSAEEEGTDMLLRGKSNEALKAIPIASQIYALRRKMAKALGD